MVTWTLIFSILIIKTPNLENEISVHVLAIESSPGPSPRGEAWNTPFTHMREIFRYIFHKKFRALPCPYAEDYTNKEYRALFEIQMYTLAMI